MILQLLSLFCLFELSVSTGVRLADGPTANSGRVEVEINRVWGTVCSRMWTQEDARVVCRELGYPRGGKPTKYASFGEGTGPVHVSHVTCFGDESSIFECRNRTGRACTHDEDAGVVCESDVTKNKTALLTGSMRLADGRSNTSGRVEVEYHGVWGTVCRDGWNIQDSRVTCRTMGFCGGSSVAHGEGAFGDGSGPIWLSDVECTGDEDDINKCPHAGWSENTCEHHSDVGVVCEYCPTGSVRLVGGTTNRTGVVTVSLGGVWGTVCSEDWSDKEASVVCRQLGFTGGSAISNREFVGLSGPIWLSDVQCTGWETQITGCHHSAGDSGGWGENDCRHYQDVAVECTNDPVLTTTVFSTTRNPNITTLKLTTTKFPTTTQKVTVPPSESTTTLPQGGPTLPQGATEPPAKIDMMVIIIIAVVVGAVIVIVIVVAVVCSVTKIKTTEAKHSILLTPRGQNNEYMMNDDDHQDGACAVAMVPMASRKVKRSDSGVYQEIPDKDSRTCDNQLPRRPSNSYVQNPTFPPRERTDGGIPLPAIPDGAELQYRSQPDGARVQYRSHPEGAVGIEMEHDHYSAILDKDEPDYLTPVKLKC